MPPTPPRDPGKLRTAISDRYDTLSNRLQRIARFALEHPNEIALETIAVIADRAEVQPSVLIRFAKAFGYSGFSEMQRVFQTRLVENSPSYSERIRQFRKEHGDVPNPTVVDVLREFATASIVSLEHLQEEIADGQLEQGIALLKERRDIHIIGQRRSFPVAAYLAYALSRVDRHAHLLDGVGGLLADQAGTISDQDVLIAISFPTYAPETLNVVTTSAERGVAIIAITDSPLSPIARYATVCFEVHDAEVRSFRSLTASLCVAQTLAVGLGLHLDQG